MLPKNAPHGNLAISNLAISNLAIRGIVANEHSQGTFGASWGNGVIQISRFANSKMFYVLMMLVIFASLLATTLAVRWPLVVLDSYINPDEAELLASGSEAYFSPVPFSTWVTSTIGPIWPLFLATLKIFGFPLTITSGHFLAAFIVSLVGLLAWRFASQSLGPWFAALIAAAWWLPISIGSPILGGPQDFNALTTNLLPCLILFLIVELDSVTRKMNRAPVALGLGVLAGLAFLSKYQVGPIAVAVVASMIISKWDLESRRIKESILASVGFFLPAVLIILVSLMSGLINFPALQITVDFFIAYGQGVTNEQKMLNFLTAVTTNPWVVFWTLLSLFAASLGTLKAWVARLSVLASGLVSVYIGGMGFGHYLLFIYCAAFLSLFITRDNVIEKWLVGGRQTLIFISISILVTTVWLVPKVLANQSSGSFSQPLTLNHVDVVPSVSDQCPPGSRVLVWGWASEFYVNYDWRPAMPFFGSAQIVWTPDNTEKARDLVGSALSLSECVVDATGSPFFGFSSEQSILNTYPWAESALTKEFDTSDLGIPCETCKLWVRKD